MKLFQSTLCFVLLTQCNAFAVRRADKSYTSLSVLPTETLAALTTPEAPVDIFAISSVQGKVVAAGAGVAAAIAGIFGFRKNESGSSPEPSSPVAKAVPIDVSIPYDAAARLEFTSWLTSHPDAINNEETFAKFKPLYEAKTVAEVKVKKQVRDLELAREAVVAAAKALEEL